MLYWKANFSIPNSGVQAAEVFLTVKKDDSTIITAEAYSDRELNNMIYNRQYHITDTIDDYEDYLLSLDEYHNYIKI
jgi:hypothetical protein